ncbi:MAG: glycosyl transferase [Candidatus Aminicenantes bacterium]|nr:glycosyl transferase [Candidatus Aminicenantes bacterium]
MLRIKILQDILLSSLLRKAIHSISPIFLMKYRHFILKGWWPDLKHPKTFDEKLMWLNFHWQHPLKTICADKYTMRFYVKKNGLSHILNILLAVYEKPEEIDFERLPKKFVLKCTHGCGFNIICSDKSRLDINKARRKLGKWLREDIGKISGERHYATIKPKIIAETFLEGLSSELPTDYKIFCFHGKAHCVMACLGRDIHGHATYYLYYDLDWKRIPYNNHSLSVAIEAPRPESLKEMINFAEILSRPFPHVRIDFYDIKGKTILGEMTFTSQGCIHVDHTETAQRIMGDLITLPDKLLF